MKIGGIYMGKHVTFDSSLANPFIRKEELDLMMAVKNHLLNLKVYVGCANLDWLKLRRR